MFHTSPIGNAPIAPRERDRDRESKSTTALSGFTKRLVYTALIGAGLILTACGNDFHDLMKSKDGGGTPPLPKYTVSFNGNGAESKPDDIPAIVSGTAITPANPIWIDNVFLGWHDITLTTKYNFPLTITADTTLYAKWQYTEVEVWNIQDFGTPTATAIFDIKDKPSFEAAKNIIEATKDNYILNVIGANVESAYIYPAADANISLRGGGTIHKSSGTGDPLFYLYRSKLVLRNATLKGYAGNDASLVLVRNDTEFIMRGGEIRDNNATRGGGVEVYGGTFTMYNGTISGNKSNGAGGGVHVGGSFTMYNGTISGNEAENIYGAYGGGVYVGGGTFTMNGGTISGNKVDGDGGGVFVDSSTFIKTGGTISGNKASGNGGGVCVNVSGGPTFTKTGGTIYGSGEAGNSNTAGTNGHAVHVKVGGATNDRYRNTTATDTNHISIPTDLSTSQGNDPWTN
ncbi:hypothetical protein FACS189487_11270 [Campylobacterota bacterium]|nr:hypothetical protein FACS189487_11270 [Campylobacterota bacterium]